jgi:hypothetical protein
VRSGRCDYLLMHLPSLQLVTMTMTSEGARPRFLILPRSVCITRMEQTDVVHLYESNYDDA